MIRALGWLWFLAVQLIALAFFLVGVLLLIPFAASGAWAVRSSTVAEFKDREVAAWRGGWLMWPWDNEEDGVVGAPFYRARFGGERLCAYCWSALRNPANNLRFVFRWRGGPFRRWEWTWLNRKFYFQAGWNPSGFPVLSAGRM